MTVSAYPNHCLTDEQVAEAIRLDRTNRKEGS